MATAMGAGHPVLCVSTGGGQHIIYTNAIESMHMQRRKIVKNRGHFPSDEATSKLLHLALRNIKKDWKMPHITWKQAVHQFASPIGECFTNGLL